MTIIENTVKLGLFGGIAVLLTGCPGLTGKCDTGDSACICADDPANAICVEVDPCDADPSLEGCPCDREAETGIGQFYYLGDFQMEGTSPDTTFASASFGYGVYALGLDDWACQLTGALGDGGDAAAGCPDCEWSFQATGVTGSVGVGDLCEDFGLTDGGADESGAYSWGFAEKYYYDYAGTPIQFDNNILLYIDADSGWFDFAFNYNGRDWVTGDVSSSSMVRPGFTSSGYAYYYYYTGEYSYDPEGCTYVE